MSISSSQNSVTYAGNESTETGYEIPFRFDDPTWLQVVRTGPSGATAVLSLTTHYTISDSELFTISEIPDTDTLTITRSAPALQELTLTPNSPLPAEALEKALDGIVMAIQDHVPAPSSDGGGGGGGDSASNAIIFPFEEPVETVRTLPDAESRKDSFLTFDAEDGGVTVTSRETLVAEVGDTVLAELVSDAIAFPTGEPSETVRTLPATADRKDTFLTFDPTTGGVTVTPRADFISDVSDLVLAEVEEIISEGSAPETGTFARTGSANTFTAANTFQGNNTYTGTNTFSGSTTLAVINGSTLALSGAASGTTLTLSGGASCTTLTASGNATIGGTLGITGATTAASLSSSSLAVSGNATVGGTLGVASKTTVGALEASGPTHLKGATKVEKLEQTVKGLSAGSTVTWDLSTHNLFTLTLAGNYTLANPTNVTPGTYILKVIRTSGTLTFSNAYRFFNGSAPNFVNSLTSDGHVFVFHNFGDDNNLYLASHEKNLRPS
jgi:hypothetical protein